MTELEKRCADAGLKMTGQRRTILKVLEEATDHPSVDDLYARAKKFDASISIATVYRTLGLLDELGLVVKHDFGGDHARFELTVNGKEHHQHHHLIDTESGRVIEFEDEDLKKIIQRVGDELGYEIVDHDIQLFGHKKKH